MFCLLCLISSFVGLLPLNVWWRLVVNLWLDSQFWVILLHGFLSLVNFLFIVFTGIVLFFLSIFALFLTSVRFKYLLTFAVCLVGSSLP